MDKMVIVKEWLDYASKDFNSAKHLLTMRPVPLEIICYHCEQAAEKMFKSFLISRDGDPPRTHNLRLLCKICAELDETFNEISRSCINLTPYGVQPRYPFEIEIRNDDMQQAIDDAEHVMNFVSKKLQNA